MTQNQNQYDVAIVGAGVCGSALTYLLSKYTNIKRIVVLEKYDDAATVNSRVSNNSQTLHFGDIETNYTLEKATKVNRASSLVKHYLLKYDPYREMHSKYNKMVLAVGQEQISILEKRYHEFKHLFPSLRMINRAEIQELEPNILKGRASDEEISALFTEEGFTVNFQKLATSFLENAAGSQDTTVDICFNTKVTNIQKIVDGYLINTSGESLQAKAVVIAAGAYSLLFAKSLGYGKDYALLSVAGSFYRSRSVLNGKVYTMQSKKLPFAAIHGDPEVHDPSITRFGPTAKVLVQLERYRGSTIIDYFRTAGLSIAAILSFATILLDWTILKYIVKNFLYDIPFIGQRLFIHEVRRIVPDMDLEDLEYAKGYGGIRPQIVNVKTRKLQLGEAKIVGERILFNITPSPGASTCLQNAEDDAEKIVEFLGDGYRFDKKRFHHDLSAQSRHLRENDEQLPSLEDDTLVGKGY